MKSFSIAYLCLLISTFTTNDTNAFLNDNTNSQAQFKAQWEEKQEPSKHGDWDKSSLRFVGQGGSCSEIFATIKNGKNTMKEKIMYEVFYTEKGSPKKGKIVFEGNSAPLTAGEEVKITFIPENAGVYMFKGYQHVDHPGNGEFWSKEIQVNCEITSEPNEKTPSTQTEKNQETTAPNNENEVQEETTSLPGNQTEVEKTEDKETTESDEGSTNTESNEANAVKVNSNQKDNNSSANDGQN